MRLPKTRRLARAVMIVAGCLLAIATGFACFRYTFASPLTRASYDLPFLWRGNLDTHEIVLVYLDEESAKKLQQPIDDIWNRSLHLPLLDRLARDGARLAFYDIVFDAASADPARDQAFATALQNFDIVILGGALETVQPMGGIAEERVIAPLKLFRKASAGWGILAFRP